jgi:cob(I)alamin adenosyltransferase
MKRKPQKVLTKIRTGSGDSGTTFLKNPMISKADVLVNFVGDLDEACACMGKATPSFDFGSGVERDFQLQLAKSFEKYQLALFEVGAMVHSESAKEQHIHKLQFYIDEISELIQEAIDNDFVEPLDGFIIPNEENADIMIARAVVRRCERSAVAANQLEFVPFLNALSDFLFLLVWESSHYFEQWKGFDD